MRSITCLPSRLEQHRAGGSLQRTGRQPAAHRAAAQACSTSLQGGEPTPTPTLPPTSPYAQPHPSPSPGALHDPTLSPTAYPNQVLSTNLQGGEAYALSPRMHEYCVALVSSLARQARPHVGA